MAGCWLCRGDVGGGPQLEAAGASLHQLMMGMVEARGADGGAMRMLGSRGALDSIRLVSTPVPHAPDIWYHAWRRWVSFI